MLSLTQLLSCLHFRNIIVLLSWITLILKALQSPLGSLSVQVFCKAMTSHYFVSISWQGKKPKPPRLFGLNYAIIKLRIKTLFRSQIELVESQWRKRHWELLESPEAILQLVKVKIFIYIILSPQSTQLHNICWSSAQAAAISKAVENLTGSNLSKY